MRGPCASAAAGYCQLRVFEGTDPLTGKKRYRTRAFRGGKRGASKELASDARRRRSTTTDAWSSSSPRHWRLDTRARCANREQGCPLVSLPR